MFQKSQNSLHDCLVYGGQSMKILTHLIYQKQIYRVVTGGSRGQRDLRATHWSTLGCAGEHPCSCWRWFWLVASRHQ
jgi:hypothetical protein